MGPVMVFFFGVVAGVLSHKKFARFWAASAVAAIGATVVWGGGQYLIFALFDRSELGPPLLVPILLTIGTALIGAVVGGAVRLIKPGDPPKQPSGVSSRS
jgi:hypothetical protein